MSPEIDLSMFPRSFQTERGLVAPSWTACGSVLTLSMPLQGDYWCVVRDAVQDSSLSVCGEPCSVHRYREVVISPPGAPIGDGRHEVKLRWTLTRAGTRSPTTASAHTPRLMRRGLNGAMVNFHRSPQASSVL